MPSRMRRRLSSFQFALPRGERPTDSGSRRAEGIVSIRAPAWGATRPAWRSSPNRRFQFALPRGERRSTNVERLNIKGFQFALPRGERPTAPPTRNCRTCFNSRSRVGSDISGQHLEQMAKFQFALPRGERPHLIVTIRSTRRVSIRAPAWGATSPLGSLPEQRRVSIRAPAWGATLPLLQHWSLHLVSIRAPAWGATWLRS